ncbi:LacI family DNA-binding transcriptional regulator [Kribbella kalugense]|uniref:LacI family transcriptional regulator n=1 Tax=Kribbella kalugense TaxID=2512221 RepID=A0A4R8A1Z2_9ACTN|nr:LacI family DNA-binding transcriptional regulator [Kribbella kalugense]TDW24226.1 LacI family transcriptional regulator [Kribbella kalugense]
MSGSRLRDVAARAGVSIRTVSNVVNGYAPVAATTRERVERAVQELDYRPNVLARSLKRGRSGMLALVVPELDVPYFSELARAIITQARLNGYTVVIDQTDGDAGRERELILRSSRAAVFDGVLLSPVALSAADISEHNPSVPIVLLGERIAASPFDHVAIDNVSAAREVTEYLFSIGRRRLAAIGDQPYETGETAQLRTQGFREAHISAARELDERLIVGCPHFHRSEGARAMSALLDGGGPTPDAVFCYNDLLAVGALRVMLSRGIRVPEDIALVGFDDIEEVRFTTPSLTTIAPDKTRLAELALQRLILRINTQDFSGPEELFVSHRLIVRESTTHGRQ